MISKDRDIESQDELTSSPSEDKVLVTEEETYPREGELLLVRRLLPNQPVELK